MVPSTVRDWPRSIITMDELISCFVYYSLEQPQSLNQEFIFCHQSNMGRSKTKNEIDKEIEEM